jgi:hypothetical protein
MEEWPQVGIQALRLHRLLTSGLRSAAKLGSITNRIAKSTPSPAELRHDQMKYHSATDFVSCPATLRAAIRVLPEVKLLGESEHQEFGIAIEIEGVPHNRKPLRDSSIDIVFIVDNAQVNALAYVGPC